MASIKCYYCKGKHTTVADVKACSTGAKPVSTPMQDWKDGQAAAIAQYPTLAPTLDAILGDDVNPDPKAELDKWQAAEQEKIAQYNADLAKVEIGTIVEETPAPAPAVPAHKAAKLAMFGTSGKVAVVPVITTEQVAEIAASLNAGNAAAAAVVNEGKTSGINFKALVEANKAAKAAVKTGQDLELGMYQVKHENGAVTIYKVKFNKTGTYKLAERLWISNKTVWDNASNTWKTVPKGTFHYASGMMAKLTSDNKMTDADAKAFHDMTKAKYGVDYGFCCVCGKLLTVKKSIAAGIGPVCADKF
jgi:hypothetical protein